MILRTNNWLMIIVSSLIHLGCTDSYIGPGEICSSNAEGSGDWEYLGLGADSLGFVTTVTVLDGAGQSEQDVILAGTAQNFSYGIVGQIFRSNDDGVSWTETYKGGSIKVMVPQPNDPNIVFALPHGVIKSTDGSTTWEDSGEGIYVDFDTRTQAIAFSPSDPSYILVGTAGALNGHLYRSRDGGLTWENLSRRPDLCWNTPRPPPLCSLGAGVVSLGYGSDGTLFAATNWSGNVLASEDDGETWRFTDLSGTGLVSTFMPDAFDDGVLYATLREQGVWRSLNGGENWAPYSEGLPDYGFMSMTQDGVSGTLYVLGARGKEGSLFRRERGHGGWEEWGVDGETLRADGALHLTSERWLYVGSYGLWRRDVATVTAAEPGPCSP